MKDAPCLSGFTACKPAESWRSQRQRLFGLSWPAQAGQEPQASAPTGGRAGRFEAAVRGGPATGLLRGRLNFHAMRVARSAMEN